MGMPISPLETVMSCTVPHTDVVQNQTGSARPFPAGLQPLGATCDYRTFCRATPRSSRSCLKRSSAASFCRRARARNSIGSPCPPSPPISSLWTFPHNRRPFCISPCSMSPTRKSPQQFRKASSTEKPGYTALCDSFTTAARANCSRRPLMSRKSSPPLSRPAKRRARAIPPLQVKAPAVPAVAEFLNSVASGTSALYGRDLRPPHR